MKRVLALLTLAAAAAGTAGTASAAPVYAGFTCGYAGVRAAALGGQFVYNGTTFDYYYVGDTASGPAAAVRIDCTILVNGAARAVASSVTAGPAGVLQPSPVSYVALPTDVVQVCTRIQATGTTGQRFFDRSSCAEVTQADGGDETGANAEPWDREAGTG